MVRKPVIIDFFDSEGLHNRYYVNTVAQPPVTTWVHPLGPPGPVSSPPPAFPQHGGPDMHRGDSYNNGQGQGYGYGNPQGQYSNYGNDHNSQTQGGYAGGYGGSPAPGQQDRFGGLPGGHGGGPGVLS